MKIAVIGLGAMGTHHVRVCKELGVLTAVCDTRSNHVHQVGKTNGVKSFSGIKEMLKEIPDLDGAVIAVPTPHHFSIASLCIEAGVNILVEKPFTGDVALATNLTEKASGHGVIIGVGYIERYNPASQTLIHLIKDGDFGDVTSINIKRVGGIPRSADNIIYDLMTHDLDILGSIFGRLPSKVSTFKQTHDGITDSAQVLLDFDTASATCESNWISPIKIRRIEVTGTEGYCSVDLIARTVSEITKNLTVTRTFTTEPLKAELKAFVNAIETGDTTDLITGEDAIRALTITSMAILGDEKNDGKNK